MRLGLNEDVKSVLYNWFLSARDKNVPVSGQTLMDKADHFTNELGITDFKATTDLKPEGVLFLSRCVVKVPVLVYQQLINGNQIN